MANIDLGDTDLTLEFGVGTLLSINQNIKTVLREELKRRGVNWADQSRRIDDQAKCLTTRFIKVMHSLHDGERACEAGYYLSYLKELAEEAMKEVLEEYLTLNDDDDEPGDPTEFEMRFSLKVAA